MIKKNNNLRYLFFILLKIVGVRCELLYMRLLNLIFAIGILILTYIISKHHSPQLKNSQHWVCEKKEKKKKRMKKK